MSRARPPPNKRLPCLRLRPINQKETNPNDHSPLVGRRIGKVLLRRFDGYHDMSRRPVTAIAEPRCMLDPVTISASTRLFYVTRDAARIGSRDQYTQVRASVLNGHFTDFQLICCDVKCSMGGLPKSQLALSWTSRLPQTARSMAGSCYALLYHRAPCSPSRSTRTAKIVLLDQQVQNIQDVW